MAEADVLRATERFYWAINRMLAGDLTPMDEVWSHADDVTEMGPFGDRQEGWEAVRTEFAKEAEMHLGGRVDPAEILVREYGDMGYSECTEYAENINVNGKLTTLHHRATNIFHREDGAWKLVHHHTDASMAGE